ncbi:hypothetical protein [Sphingobacterium multivorum]|uniref:hypothetical protein n=1 Tax=Sphingobacterium multivorum TaxID=28454 RepID=UPI0028B07CF4|nr:hypothetical protein [Sphingobacterium multivorum]
MEPKFKINYAVTFFNGKLVSGYMNVSGDSKLTRKRVENMAMDSVVESVSTDHTSGIQKVVITIDKI